MDILEIEEAKEALEEFDYECEIAGRELRVRRNGRMVDILVSIGGIHKQSVDNLIEALGI